MTTRGRAAFDPIFTEVLSNELAAVAEEMAVVIWKSGRSPMVRTGDFATAVTDAAGRILGHGFAAPFQIAALHHLAVHVLTNFSSGMDPGDVLISNDPYSGMTHLPDVAIVVPVFADNALIGLCMAYSHHSDIGGRFAGGSSSQPRTIFEEGLRIPTLKLWSRGVRNDSVLETIQSNVRTPEDWLGDTMAKVAGCHQGVRAMHHLVAKYGQGRFLSACDQIIEHAARSMRRVVGEIPVGVYVYEDSIDDDGLTSAGQLILRVTVTATGDRLVVDFGGSAAQVDGALNVPLSMTRAAVYGAVKCLFGSGALPDAGFFDSVEVVAPTGSIFNPDFPAAVGGRAPIFFRIFDLMFRALAQAMPAHVPVPSEGGDILHYSGYDRSRRPFAVLDLFFGGWGARVSKDGIDGVAPVYMGSQGNIAAELLERELPLVVEGFGFLADTEGAGTYRGSLAVFRRWRFLQAGNVMMRTIRLRPAPGFAGGLPGDGPRTVLTEQGHATAIEGTMHAHFAVNAGTTLLHVTGGAAGFGSPRNRECASVLADVIEQKVSISRARDVYGVVIDPTTMAIDGDGTKIARSDQDRGIDRLPEAESRP